MKVRATTITLAGLLLMLLLLSTRAATSAGIAPAPTQSPPTLASAGPERPVLRMRIGTFDPLETLPLGTQAASTGPALRLIQFPGPIQDVWYDAMNGAGLEIVAYIPDYAYLVWGTAGQAQQVADAAPVRWEGIYQPAYAVHPALQASVQAAPEAADVEVAIQLYDHPGAGEVLGHLHSLATDVIRPALRVQGTVVIGLQVPQETLATLASLPGVISVEPLMRPEKLDEVQGQIMAGNLNAAGSQPSGPGYLTWLTATVGLPTVPSSYPIVDIVDDGIDDGDATPIHADFYESGDTGRPDRLIYNKNWTGDASADAGGGHGNLNASIVGGYNARAGAAYEDTAGYNYGLGINPFGRIAGSKVFNNAGYWAWPDYNEMVAYSYAQGARIVTNSWGDPNGTGSYLIDDQIYDGLVRDATTSMPGSQGMTVIFAAGNAGPGGSTIGSPGNAKNVITVGASENYRPTWTDGCGVGTSGANDANDIIGFSSRGPTADGRAKPDLVAPGTHILGAASQASSYNGTGVCNAYYPAGQTLYASSSGTSHSAPAVAGAASVLTRFYQDAFGSYPSPAMLKAYLINSARYLDGVSSGDSLPSNNQGYGSVDLGLSFDDAPRLVQDQTTVLQSTGTSVVIEGSVARTDRPFRVTLVWTDAPGSASSASYVNNLNLTVTVEGQTYRGNIFSGAYSIPGGSADFRNNVESIFLPAGTEGAFTITVTAFNLAGDGVPGNGDPTDQDFALVCYNCESVPTFSLNATPAVQSVCRPDAATYTVATEALAGFSDAITLQATGNPVGSSVSLIPNPVTPGSASTLTIIETGSTPSGEYRITITGTAVAQTKSTFVDLKVLTSVPATPILFAPAQGAQNVPAQPTLQWSAVPGADLYVVEVATSTTFLPPVYSATSAVAEHTLAISLVPETQYYWRVTARNACGAGTASPARAFTTAVHAGIFCATPRISIPDGNATAGAMSRVTLPMTGTLVSLRVAVTVTHAWVGDLVMTLKHVDTGELIQLYDRPGLSTLMPAGCAGRDFALSLADYGNLSVQSSCLASQPAYLAENTYRPLESLSAFLGDSPFGEWELHVTDEVSLSTGSLDAWCLIPRLSTDFPYAVYVPVIARNAP